MNNDLISRSELKKAFEDTNEAVFSLNRVKHLIDNAPTVCGNNPKWCESCVSKGKCTSTRPQGEWTVDDWSKIIECNKCRGQAPIDVTSGEQYRSNFCPICGADMRGGGANE